MASLAEVPKTQACRMETSSWADINVKRGHLLTSTMTGLFRACRAEEAGGVEGPAEAGTGTGGGGGGGTVGLRMGVAPQLLVRLLTLDTTNKDPTTQFHTQSPQQHKQDTHTQRHKPLVKHKQGEALD